MTTLHRCIIAAFIAHAATSIQAADLETVVATVGSSEGNLRYALYASEADFRQKALAVHAEPAKPGEIRFVFKDLPAGDYALLVYHDRNDNKELDSNLFGMPSEPWGASLEERSVFGAPGWQDTVISVPAEGRRVQIRLND